MLYACDTAAKLCKLILLCCTVTQVVQQCNPSVQGAGATARLQSNQTVTAVQMLHMFCIRTNLYECNQVLSALTAGLYCRVRVSVTVSARY
jgi:hypothetical protein